MAKKRISYTRYRHELTGRFVSNAYAKRYPSKVEKVEIRYTRK